METVRNEWYKFVQINIGRGFFYYLIKHKWGDKYVE